MVTITGRGIREVDPNVIAHLKLLPPDETLKVFDLRSGSGISGCLIAYLADGFY